MSDTSGDEYSDFDVDLRPSTSKAKTKSNIQSASKRRRRILMRIEFDDSEEDSTSAATTTYSNSNSDADEDNIAVQNDLDEQPSCSSASRIAKRTRSAQKQHSQGTTVVNAGAAAESANSEEEFSRNVSQRLRKRRRNIPGLESNRILESDSSSGSEVIAESRKQRLREKKLSKKYVVSEDDHEKQSQSPVKVNQETTGFASDSSSNELLEKCPICLLTFRQQEIGSPATCDHIFCANCIEAWSKNVQTCPIDRLEFERIIVRASFENRNIVREIKVDSEKQQKGLVLDDDEVLIVEDDEITCCEVCNRSDREDVMLLCDSCNQGYHIDCLTPPLNDIPTGSWYCDNCFDSQDEDDEDVAEDLSLLYDDIRDMGIPEESFRVTEVQQPRILRTRQNERLRAAIMRRTRSNSARTQTTRTTTTTTTMGTSRRGRPGRTTTTTTTTTTRTTRPKSKKRRRRARQRTYVVEYDLNTYDEKFAIKTSKKIVRRRKRKHRSSKRTSMRMNNEMGRMTASQRLAEQLGVKRDPTYSSQLSGTNAGLSLFGNANDLEYFSDSDNNDGMHSEVQIETGHGTAIQTSVRLSNIGPRRARKGLLLGRLQRNPRPIPEPNVANSTTDVLSSIMDMQDRWHSATRNLGHVHISSDGMLNFEQNGNSRTESTSQTNSIPNRNENIPKCSESNGTTRGTQPQSIRPNDITQAPMYPRGNNPFSTGGGGGGGSVGGYNNRFANSYRGGGGGGGVGQYNRQSTGGMITNSNVSNNGNNFNTNDGGNRSNFNFGNTNLNTNQNSTFSPFSIRFNQRNQSNNNNNQRNNQNQNNQRHSLPFTNQRNDNMQMQSNNFNMHSQAPLQPQRTQQSQPPPLMDSNSLFGGLPPPIGPQIGQNPPGSGVNDTTLFTNLPPPPAIGIPRLPIPPLMSVPPPPAPPPGVQLPWNNSLFQLNTDYGNDDDSNCPNFSVYSAESQAVAKSNDVTRIGSQSTEPKEHDENEDLVQLDDDEEIPMPPESTAINANASNLIGVEHKDELYEPENPTEENEDDDDVDNGNCDGDDNGMTNEEHNNDTLTKYTRNRDHNANNTNRKQDDQYDPEEDTVSQVNSNFDNAENDSIAAVERIEDSQCHAPSTSKTSRTPSPSLSEIKLPESEVSATNRKGVLELYDDSDWEELDIDKPRGVEKTLIERKKVTERTAADMPSVEESNNASKKEETAKDTNAEPDRSYTPCLDEHNEPEEAESETPEQRPTATTPETNANITKSSENASGIAGMETELISDEEENSRGKNKRRNEKHEKHDKRDKENVETFKKVSNKQKERNYRSEKQHQQHGGKNMNRRRSSRSLSRRSPSRDRALKSRRSRSRSRSRNIRSISRVHSRSRSRSRSPRGRMGGRRRTRSRSLRSRSRSNNRQGRSGGRGRFHRMRPKRRELPRYDVRNVVGNNQRHLKDRYGRDRDVTRPMRSHSRSRSRSISRGRRPRSYSRSRSISAKRTRRCSFSISPSPAPPNHRGSSMSPRRLRTPPPPPRRRLSPPGGRIVSPPPRPHTRSPLRLRSRSLSPTANRMNGRKVTRRMREFSMSPHGPPLSGRSQSRSFSVSPRYTPRLSKSRSRSHSPNSRLKNRKKKNRDRRKKRGKKRLTSVSPEPIRRLSRQRDPFEMDICKPVKKKRRHSPKVKTPQENTQQQSTWSPSPSPPPLHNYNHENLTSWTPPIHLTNVDVSAGDLYEPDTRRSGSRTSKKDKRKRTKKKKKTEKRRDGRKDKRRSRRTETPEPAPSKEVFASGNNILVSVSFNKEANNQLQQQQPQTTVVTLPPTREELLVNRRTSVDRLTNSSLSKNKKKDKSQKRKKLDAKPVAIIDLERSPFQVHQEPADIIVLTDSEDARDEEADGVYRHERRRSTSATDDIDHHRPPLRGNSRDRESLQRDKTPPLERLDTIMEESYDLPQTGPKTPPEPPIVKFSLPMKKQNKVRNPLHDESELNSETELEERTEQDVAHRAELDALHVQSAQKIGPNTPPESGPCSPDAYDPFEPTKSPSMSPRSPTPPPMDVSQASIDDSADGSTAPSKHINSSGDEQRLSGERGLAGNSTVTGGNAVVQATSLNPVELVMALMNTKTNSSQDLTNKSNESQFSNSSHMHSGSSGGGIGGMSSSTHDDSMSLRDKSDDGNTINVISNVLITPTAQSQHIPIISSPTPMVKSTTQIMKLPLPKVGGSVGSSSSVGLPVSNVRNGGGGSGGTDDQPPSFNINDIESPYSPGSADYEDLFEPPPDTSSAKRRNPKRGGVGASGGGGPASAGGKTEVFDNLFGSASPIAHVRLPSYGPSSSRKQKNIPVASNSNRKPKVKVGKSDEHSKVYDDMPNSAVELQVKDKFLRKLNRQERVVEEVKLVLKPRFNKKQITKEDYKEIMRRAVPKICHSRSGEINPHKIKNLIEAYVKKFRAKHKKLNLINTGQVSSAVKCAAYLKKL